MGILPVISGFQAYDDARTKTGDPNDRSLTGGAGKAFCRAWNSKPARYLQPLVGGTTNPALLRAPNEFCRPYNENEGIEPPSYDLPFQGGQCPGVSYRLRVEGYYYQGNGGSAVEAFIAAEYSTFVPSPFSNVAFIDKADYGYPQPTFRVIEITNSAGAKSIVGGGTVTGNRWIRGSFRFVRTNGAADTCGNPPPVLTPSPNAPDIDFGDDQTINVGGDSNTFNVGSPQIDIDGNLYVPITVNGGDTFNFSPTATPPNVPDLPQPPTVEGEPVDVPDGGGEVNDDGSGEDEGRELIGYRWRFTNAPLQRGWIVATSPRVSPRVFGNVRLKLQGSEGTFWGTNLEIDSVEGFICRPSDKVKVKGVVLQSEGSYNQSQLIPVYAIRGTNGR